MRDRVYSNKPSSLCYGCNACEQICPHNAIEMTKNIEGFSYPLIDQKRCTDCGLCEKVCPTQDMGVSKVLFPKQTKCYAAWNKKLENRLKSTSGGIYFLLAKDFIEKGGVAYGVGMNEDLTAYHYRVDNIVALESFRGSKYIQSDTNTTYKQVKSDLRNEVKVLYVGTPCQIAGLRLFLIKDYANLFTIDLVCHGVPSPLIFKEHLKYLNTKYDSNITNLLFRGKKKSGWRAYVTYVLENNKLIYKQTGQDFYFHAFCAGYFNRESCFECEYSRAERCGDITLSDFWGGENVYNELKLARKNGYNLVICSSEKGNELFNNIGPLINKLECDIEVAIKGDIRLREAEIKPFVRDIIYKEMKENGYEYIVRKYKHRPSIINNLVPNFVKNLIREVAARL